MDANGDAHADQPDDAQPDRPASSPTDAEHPLAGGAEQHPAPGAETPAGTDTEQRSGADVEQHAGAGTDQPPVAAPAPVRRLRVRRLLATGGVALLVAAIVAVVAGLHHYNNPAPPAGHGHPQDLADLPTPGPLCRLKVVEHGITVEPDYPSGVHYAAVIRNPCPDVAVNVRIAVYPMSKAGHRLGLTSITPTEDTPTITALAPGARTAVAGRIAALDSRDFKLSDVGDVDIHLLYSSWTTTKKLAAKGGSHEALAKLLRHPPTARHVRILDTHSSGIAQVGCTLHTTAAVDDDFTQRMTFVARDKSGRIIGGATTLPHMLNTPLVTSMHDRSAEGVAPTVWLPPHTDRSNLDVFWSPYLPRS